MKQFFTFLFLLVAVIQLKAQVSLTNAAPSNTQNFDGMAAGTTLPANWRIQQSASPLWTDGGSALGAQASSGSPTTGATYNWGTTAAVDRAAGVMTSGTYGSPSSLMAFYSNGDAINTISEITVSYTAERYRINTAAASIQFYYSTDGLTWLAVTTGDIAASSFTIGTSNYTFASPLTINVSATITTSITAGANFYLRWDLTTTGANSQGIGIDNVVVSAVFTVDGSYRSTTAGIWGTTATWERFAAGTWSVSAAPAINNTTDNIYIRHAISSGGSISAGKIIIENAGTLTYTAASTCGTSMLIKNGGILQINAALTANAATIFTIESGGRMNLNNATTNGISAIWNGIENFQSGSIIEIQNWDYGAGGGDNRLIQNPSIISANTTGGYYFGNLIISGNPSVIFVMSEGSQTINLCENNFTSSALSATVSVAFTNAISNVTIGGNLIVTNNQFSFAATTTGNPISTVLGNIQPTGGAVNLNQNNSGTATSTVQLKGNLSIPAGAALASTDAGCKIVFSGTGIQTISIAGTLNANVDIEVDNGATTQFINQNLNLVNASNGFTVLAGGIHEFNGFDITGAGVFDLQATGTIKITSVNGVNASPSALGNVRNTGTRTFSQTAYYHYVGAITPQSTGTAITGGSTAKRIIIEKTTATDIVNLTQSTGIATSGSGYLSIIQGILNESVTSVITGSGDLLMSGGEYRMPVTVTTLPQLTGGYNLTGGTIVLNGAGNQVLRGARDYRNLTFSNNGIKTLTSSPSSVTGTITIENNAVLNVGSNTMGGVGTDLTMTGTSQYITAGTGTKPDAQGTYTLAAGTSIEFTNSLATQQNIRLSPAYSNIIISGNNVGNSSLTTGIDMKPGSSFTVTSTGIFHLQNTNGFTGASTTAVNTSNNPIINLQTGSGIEYYGATAQVFTARNDYQNVIISGGGNKTLDGASVINGILTLLNGLIITTPTNLLTMNTSATVAPIPLGPVPSYVSGPVRKIGTAAFVFPVGKATFGYRPIAIGPAAASNTFTAEMMRSSAMGMGPITVSGLQRVSRCEYWVLDRNAGSSPVNVTLSWTSESPCNVGYVSDPPTVVVAHFNGTSWDSYGGAGTGVATPGAGTATWNNVSVFSPFALGTTSVAENPLPFGLSSFTATLRNEDVLINWQVNNNQEYKLYEVEKSTDGRSYEVLTAATATAQLADSYSIEDRKPVYAWNYYRLRAKDQQGSVTVSDMVRVWYSKKAEITISPNPASEKIVINLPQPSSIFTIQLVNSTGQVLAQKNKIQTFTEIDISHLQAGMYYIRITGKDGLSVKNFVKQ